MNHQQKKWSSGNRRSSMFWPAEGRMGLGASRSATRPDAVHQRFEPISITHQTSAGVVFWAPDEFADVRSDVPPRRNPSDRPTRLAHCQSRTRPLPASALLHTSPIDSTLLFSSRPDRPDGAGRCCCYAFIFITKRRWGIHIPERSFIFTRRRALFFFAAPPEQLWMKLVAQPVDRPARPEAPWLGNTMHV